MDASLGKMRRPCGTPVPASRALTLWASNLVCDLAMMLRVVEDLIYDVGLHDGSDTAYYLHRGYRVVAIDADPTSISNARAKFAQEIADGRLTLLHRMICDRDGEQRFFICPDSPDWSSADPAWAERARRDGLTVREEIVPCARMSSILREFGVPHYLKIDIEGHGDNCVEALEPTSLPRYISNEITETESLALLWSKGYRRFKLIDQATLQPLPYPPRRASLKSVLRKRSFVRSFVRGTVQGAERVLGRRILTYRPKAKANGWTFPVRTSSGPFGKDLPGPWLDLERAACVFCNELRRIGYAEKRIDLLWLDVHAEAPPAHSPPSPVEAKSARA